MPTSLPRKCASPDPPSLNSRLATWLTNPRCIISTFLSWCTACGISIITKRNTTGSASKSRLHFLINDSKLLFVVLSLSATLWSLSFQPLYITTISLSLSTSFTRLLAFDVVVGNLQVCTQSCMSCCMTVRVHSSQVGAYVHCTRPIIVLLF
ncbi:hypothetical protein BDZ97DRAFT_888018 [Flammula alnicola]|nr:hypothetical protein BDZ97DRAFT_888018 [Flammula alnicola]